MNTTVQLVTLPHGVHASLFSMWATLEISSFTIYTRIIIVLIAKLQPSGYITQSW